MSMHQNVPFPNVIVLHFSWEGHSLINTLSELPDGMTALLYGPPCTYGEA